ncbi:hypothetical protein NPIL_184301, partial [Nephila pilipes]
PTHPERSYTFSTDDGLDEYADQDRKKTAIQFDIRHMRVCFVLFQNGI